MGEVSRIALAARVFALAALLPLAVVAGPSYLRGAGLVLLVAAGALQLGHWTSVPQWVVAITEGCVVAVLAVLTFPDDAVVTPYLVIPAMIGGLDLGRRGLVRVLLSEFGTLLVTWAVWVHDVDRMFAASGVTWLATSIGTGLMGVALRRALHTGDASASYRDALGLIRRLEALSGRLSGGLDAVGIAEQVLVRAEDRLDVRSAGVFVRSPGGELAPLRYTPGTRAEAMEWAQELAAACWQGGRTVIDGAHLAVPVRTGDEVAGVLAVETDEVAAPEEVAGLESDTQELALQLQAALVFGRVRERATSQERQRIAREVHDGVAQDVASLGYLVDNIAGSATDPAQQDQIALLRREVTRVVGDLRHSIFDLRQEIPAGSGLGESLSAYANRVAATSPMTVHVTVDERGPRLPGDVEFELFRIGQEAMANARKHSGGQNLWLRCVVDPPYAEIEVRDDGTAFRAPRPDSHGLTIMRERATGIGADLHVEPPGPDRTGTRVSVRMPGSGASVPPGGRA